MELQNISIQHQWKCFVHKIMGASSNLVLLEFFHCVDRNWNKQNLHGLVRHLLKVFNFFLFTILLQRFFDKMKEKTLLICIFLSKKILVSLPSMQPTANSARECIIQVSISQELCANHSRWVRKGNLELESRDYNTRIWIKKENVASLQL